MSLVVLLDVDGVLCDTLAHAGVDATKMPSWEEPPPELFEAFEQPEFVRTIPPCRNAMAGVAELRRFAEVVFVTSPWDSNPTWAHERGRWLARHFGAGRDNVIHTGAKHHVRGSVFVDDRPRAVEKWTVSHPNGKGLVWAQPYNVATNLPRVESWAALLGIVVAS